MIFKNYIDDLADRLKQEATDDKVRTILGRKINQAYKEVANAADWPDLKRLSDVVTVQNYSTGIATTTQGSNIVTFSGSTLDSSMEGRYFKSQANNTWYTIAKVNSNLQITLSLPINEASQSGAFTIWKRFYPLNSDVRKISLFGEWIKDGELEGRSERWLGDHSANISNVSEIENYSLFGVNLFNTTYSIQTASVAQDSDVATGVNTFWLGNVTPGDIFEIGTQVLRVKRVETDTSIRLLNFAKSPLTDSYTIRKDAQRTIQFYGNPNQAQVLPYSYQKRVYDMVNESKDRPELSDDFDLAILDMAEASRMMDLQDDSRLPKMQIAMARIRDLKLTQLGDSPRYRQMIPRIPTRRSY